MIAMVVYHTNYNLLFIAKLHRNISVLLRTVDQNLEFRINFLELTE